MKYLAETFKNFTNFKNIYSEIFHRASLNNGLQPVQLTHAGSALTDSRKKSNAKTYCENITYKSEKFNWTDKPLHGTMNWPQYRNKHWKSKQLLHRQSWPKPSSFLVS